MNLDKVFTDVVEKNLENLTALEYYNNHGGSHDYRAWNGHVIAEIEFYLILRSGERYIDRELDAQVIFNILKEYEYPQISYAAIHHFTYDDLDFSTAEFDDIGKEGQQFDDSDIELYILAECCNNSEVADYYFQHNRKLYGVSKMIYNIFLRLWKYKKLTLLSGYTVMKHIYRTEKMLCEDDNIYEIMASDFIDRVDIDSQRGYNRAINIIRELCV